MKSNKFNFLLVFIVLLTSSCNKSNTNKALIPDLNGVWELCNIQSQNPINDPTLVFVKGETWSIMGNQLEVSLSNSVNYTKITSGKHEIMIVEDLNEDQFLQIRDISFGAIEVKTDRLVINTSRKPNESISHASTYIFTKVE